MFPRRFARLAAALIIAMTLALPFTPAAHAQSAVTTTASAATTCEGGSWSGYWTWTGTAWHWTWVWNSCSGWTSS